VKILFVNPEFPVTYWGFQHTLSLVGKRVNLPPLGLVTVAALLPRDWTLRLVDVNIRPLTDRDLAWADVVLTGGMRIQADSMHEILERARAAGRRTVVGGPAPTTSPDDYPDADVVFCGEAEDRVDELVTAISAKAPTHLVLCAADGCRPAMSISPLPRFDLLELKHYAVAGVQFSRGCPFTCEFCDIVEIFGHTPRVKSPAQIIAEIDALYELGFHGPVFLVDDNFIGNKKAVRALLPELERWQREHRFPYELLTEASINLAADDDLMAAMVRCGFNAVFIGIETPSVEALAGAGKKQNLKLDLAAGVARMTAAGLEVMGGFIVGFDEDDAQIFARQADFIAATPIPLAMVGLLTALPGTALWRRLGTQGRLRSSGSGDQFERPNFETVMDEETLLRGYARLLAQIYAPTAYYDRCAAVLRQSPKTPGSRPVKFIDVIILLKAVVRIGVFSRSRRHFWSLVFLSLRSKGRQIPWVISQAIKGEHLIRYTRKELLPRIRRTIVELQAAPSRASLAVRTARAARAPSLPMGA